jgi:hypothetical protein
MARIPLMGGGVELYHDRVRLGTLTRYFDALDEDPLASFEG